MCIRDRYKVDSTPTTDPASPDYTGKVKQITDENGNIEYYLGINASDIITTGTALSINITAEANNTSSKVVIYDPATEPVSYTHLAQIIRWQSMKTETFGL